MYSVHASAHFYYHGERPSLARHHACDNVFFPSLQGTCRAYPSASRRRSAGWPTSGRYYDDDSVFRTYSSDASFSLCRSGIGACRKSVSAGFSSDFFNAALRGDFVWVT